MNEIIQTMESWVSRIPQSALIVVPLVILAIILAARILMIFVHPVLISAAKRAGGNWDKEVIAKILRPLEMLAAVSLLTIITPILPVEKPVISLLLQIEKTLYAIAGFWLTFSLINIISDRKIKQLNRKGKSGAANVIPLLRRTIKAVLFAVVFLFLLQNFGIDISALLAGLGIGGLAIALAGQKTFENLFGGIVIILDQPVKVGDYCRVGTDLEGIVEDIGLRSTRIRTLDRTVITISNAEFSQMQIENYGKRDRIRLFTTIGVRYETTPDQMRYLLIELRKMLHSHPKVDRELCRVRFKEFSACSLDIEIMAYVLTSQWIEYVAVREDIYLRILEMVNNSGTGFAFPSQTVYMERGDGIDKARTKAVEENVSKWRKENKLFMPDVPEDAIQKLDDTLDYPPKGGALNDSLKIY